MPLTHSPLRRGSFNFGLTLFPLIDYPPILGLECWNKPISIPHHAMRTPSFLVLLGRKCAAPWLQLYRNIRQGPARLPEELIEKGPRIQASAQYGGMGERELELRMEQIVDRILSSRHSVHEPAQQLTVFNHFEQRRFLESGQVLADSNGELAYQFFHFGIKSLRLIDEKDWDDWLNHLCACYDRSGVNGAVQAMRQVENYLRQRLGGARSVRLDDVERLIESLLIGFGGRPLKVASSVESYTDTETVYLPSLLDVFETRKENLDLLKAIAAHLWAQTRYGTYRVSADTLSAYPDQARARDYFHVLETLRLNARIRHIMPGIGRTLERINPPETWARLSAEWADATAEISEPKSTAEDSLRLIGKLYPTDVTLPEVRYQGRLRPEIAAEIIATRVEEERHQLANALLGLKQDLSPFQAEDKQGKRFTVHRDQERLGDEFAFSLKFGDEVITPPEDIQQLLESITQDFDGIPDDYLEPAGAGAYTSTPEELDAPLPEATRDAHHVYPEWDHSRQKYRPDWCQLYERPITGSSEQFAKDVLNRHRRLLTGLRRTFEALRDEEKRIRREPYGDEVDLDSFVNVYSDYLNGSELDERLFTRLKKLDRDIAVMFLIDMSGSTAGWVNDLVRESLILLCNALGALGDRYAIYGFSGRTHRNCELYPIKTLAEPYNSEVCRRISGITPRDYTRMGVMIRHLTRLLKDTEARTRLLVTLSDGKPDDQDGYRGTYGIEDTRQALNEARYLGIHPYCITIDKEGMEYLPHMYGSSNFALVSHIEKLPLKVSDIYRRITL